MTNPIATKRRIASRNGPRLTENCSASEGSLSFSPGAIWPFTIASRKAAVVWPLRVLSLSAMSDECSFIDAELLAWLAFDGSELGGIVFGIISAE